LKFFVRGIRRSFTDRFGIIKIVDLWYEERIIYEIQGH